MDFKALLSALPQEPFFFLRHGETEWNRTRLAQGQTDIPLNETGRDQAALAMPLLTGQGISLLVSSPLLWAYDTAEIVNRSLGLSIVRHSGLMERAFGEAEGQPWRAGFVDAELGDGSETIPAFFERILIALSETLTRYPGPLLIVSHGGVYRAFANVLCGIQDARAPNSVPFRFDPPEEHSSRWRITPVDPVNKANQ